VLFSDLAPPHGEEDQPDPQTGLRDDSARFPRVDLADHGGGDERGVELAEVVRVLTRKSGERLLKGAANGVTRSPSRWRSSRSKAETTGRSSAPIGARIARERVRGRRGPDGAYLASPPRLDPRTAETRGGTESSCSTRSATRTRHLHASPRRPEDSREDRRRFRRFGAGAPCDTEPETVLARSSSRRRSPLFSVPP